MSEHLIPKRGTPEYAWWARGAEAEHDLAVRDLTPAQLDVRDTWDGMCRLRNRGTGEEPVTETIAVLARIFWAGQPWWRRLHLAWKAIR